MAQRTSLSASPRLRLCFRLSHRNGAAVNTGFTVRGSPALQYFVFTQSAAISTVVNNPNKRSAPPKAHAPVPTVTPVVLPRPNRKILDQYAQNVASDWNHLLQSRLNATEQFEGSSNDFLGTSQHVGKEFPPLDSVPLVFFDPQFSLGNPRMFRAVTGQEEDQYSPDAASLAYSLPLI